MHNSNRLTRPVQHGRNPLHPRLRDACQIHPLWPASSSHPHSKKSSSLLSGRGTFSFLEIRQSILLVHGVYPANTGCVPYESVYHHRPSSRRPPRLRIQRSPRRSGTVLPLSPSSMLTYPIAETTPIRQRAQREQSQDPHPPIHIPGQEMEGYTSRRRRPFGE